jgi:hypothetical protein
MFFGAMQHALTAQADDERHLISQPMPLGAGPSGPGLRREPRPHRIVPPCLPAVLLIYASWAPVWLSLLAILNVALSSRLSAEGPIPAKPARPTRRLRAHPHPIAW